MAVKATASSSLFFIIYVLGFEYSRYEFSAGKARQTAPFISPITFEKWVDSSARDASHFIGNCFPTSRSRVGGGARGLLPPPGHPCVARTGVMGSRVARVAVARAWSFSSRTSFRVATPDRFLVFELLSRSNPCKHRVSMKTYVVSIPCASSLGLGRYAATRTTERTRYGSIHKSSSGR